MRTFSRWRDAMVAASILLSAGTYLFDFGSNLVVLVQYSTRFMNLMHREEGSISSCNAVCRLQTSELAGYFYALLAILVCCHSLNALLFKLKFTHKEAPLFAAYFLPLIHLYRLSHLLRNPHRLLAALAFSYMSMNLGPLYPLISQANDANQLGSIIFRLKLLALSLFHLSLDLAVLCVTKMLGTLPKLYIIISSLTAVGYMLSLISYMKFDASCGPAKAAASSSIIPATHGDDDGSEHKLVSLRELFILADAQRQESVKSEADAVSRHINPSPENIDLVRSEKSVAILGCPVEGFFPSEMHSNIGAHQQDVDVPEAKGSRPRLTSSLSLEKADHLLFTRETLKITQRRTSF